MKTKLTIFTLTSSLILSMLVGCSDDSGNQILNKSDQFIVCNNLLSECVNGNASYCLFGYKWGTTNPFTPTGFNASGPQESGGIITYSFQEINGLVNTHSQINLPSQSFNLLPSCTMDMVRMAFDEWEEQADIEFQELTVNSPGDIRLFVVASRQTGIGYPNYPEEPCSDLGGQVIIKADLELEDCDLIRKFLLHEIGHVLGLGHVNSDNIMNQDIEVIESLDGLQDGDIEGLVELYGEK